MDLTAVLTAQEAAAERSRHEGRADALTAAHRERRARHEKHPVEDFLHTYYPFSPAFLRRWHPGWRVGYEADADRDLAGVGDVVEDGTRRHYIDSRSPAGGVAVRRADVAGFLAKRADAVRFMHRLLTRSQLGVRPANLSCFGLHEWAMVYRLQPGQQRHEDLPLRLGQAETDRVVEANQLVCSHIDAFRFFTPQAVPRNSMEPTRATQVQRDNPACLHVGMDLYKWAAKLVPLVPSSLVLDCFEHARSTRLLDMEASPYDVRPLGYGVVAIETPEGKAEYVRRQKELAQGAQQLRRRILEHLDPLIAAGSEEDAHRLGSGAHRSR
ncbi:3-methyladenine DNA glycosylase [Helcobacillus massiliensis]|uniref:3-methyladenine DNA glycosylase n=1 Tax=Helcobacillus massiliensis TaxID=521392 RepID=A0A839QVY3_9MICO|nr:3-methyladenine DNA glycosylase [Helcobacillus massiliensis]MBB3022161.1 hypothetical protein [Helcobacillus massiliensis]